jgi:hypothetical protein
VKVKRVSFGDDVTVKAPSCAFVIWEAMYSPNPMSLPARAGLAAEERLEKLLHRRFRYRLAGVSDPELERSVARCGANDDRLAGCAMRQGVADS